jgi:predicted nucleic acid-binding protein
MVKIVVDTGPLVAFFREDDEYHPWAEEVFKTIRPPLFTTESVITETAHFIAMSGFSRKRLLNWIDSGGLQIPLQLPEHALAVAALMEKYGNRMDLADATLVRLSEMFDDCRVLTTDRGDFSFYRRHGRQMIPLLTPPD